jgi:hypothetical protein
VRIIYLEKERQNTTMADTNATVRSLTRRVKVYHKLFMATFLSSSDSFYDLHTRGINCCGNVKQNHEGMPREFDKTLKQTGLHTC